MSMKGYSGKCFTPPKKASPTKKVGNIVTQGTAAPIKISKRR